MKQNIASSSKSERREWSFSFENVFMDPQARCTPPDKVFREGFEYYFFFDGAFFDQAYFQTLQQMLADLGEKAFAIKGAGAFQGYDKTYSVPCSWQEYTGELGESFILTVQPLNFYLCGERDDWGIVVTTDFDMAIIGCKGDASPVISSYAEGDAEDARKWLFRPGRNTRSDRLKENFLQ